MAKKKYTRKAYFDKKSGDYKIYYTNILGKTKIVADNIYVKRYVTFILSEENEGKNQKSFKVPSKKDSVKIKSRIEIDKVKFKTVDKLLKKPAEKITDHEKELLNLYSNTPYRQNELIKKEKEVLTKKEVKERVKKKEIQVDNYIIIKDYYVTYCHTSQAFFYFANPVPKKENQKTNEEKISNHLKRLLYYDNSTKKFLKNKKYHRVRIYYNSEFFDDEIYGEYDAPENMQELEEIMESFMKDAGEVAWTNELCNIKIEGLL